ncbi:MAG TPA: PEP-CTERM sorting domain-containing protein, partial [Rhodocyclaceae bacterium]|nr:PEP-CTERM sorting domain-containing protein [Rhodocyclaceae bacterium]
RILMIQTVLGLVGDQQLGLTLPHEHVLVGFIPDGKLSAKDYDRDEVRLVALSGIAPVPEPQAWTLMLAGLGVSVYLARRRRS